MVEHEILKLEVSTIQRELIHMMLAGGRIRYSSTGSTPFSRPWPERGGSPQFQQTERCADYGPRRRHARCQFTPEHFQLTGFEVAFALPAGLASRSRRSCRHQARRPDCNKSRALGEVGEWSVRSISRSYSPCPGTMQAKQQRNIGARLAAAPPAGGSLPSR